MKLSTLFGLVVLCMSQQTLAFGIDFQYPVRLGGKYAHYAVTELRWWLRRRPIISQFILDAEHPWLSSTHGKALLYASTNASDALCSLSSPLRPNSDPFEKLVAPEHWGRRHTPCDSTPFEANTTTYPADLFTYLEIDNNRYEIDRPGWKNAQARLEEMLACPAALNDVQEFKVEIYVSDGSFEIGRTEPATPPADLPDLFVQALSQMKNLQSLEWNIYGIEKKNSQFRDAFLAAGLHLPSVRFLRPAIYCDWLIDVCPGVERLQSGQSESTAGYWRESWNPINGRAAFINSTRRLDNLTSFSMNGEWNFGLIQALLEASPDLKVLSAVGSLGIEERHYRYSMDSENNSPTLQDWAEFISRFPRLETLGLPASYELGLGFDGAPGCGNAYFGPEGCRYLRHEMREALKTTEEAGRIVLREVPTLKGLNIGSYAANVTSFENGTASATWDWTGRMEEYLLENWPDCPNEADES